MSSNKKTDEEIAVQVQDGGVHLFEELIHRYEDKMMRYANRFLSQYEDRQDAVQDVFIRAYENIQSFDSNRKLSPWLYRVAHNTFINFIKKHGKERVAFFDTDSIFAHKLSDESIAENKDRKEIKEVLDQALGKIDLKYRESLVLYYYEDKSYQEISEILRIPQSTVGVRLSRGREKLKKVYNKIIK